MPYGLQPTGFVAKTADVILSEIEADQLADVDATLYLGVDEPLGQFNGIYASELAEAWEILDTIYSGLDPDESENAQLDKAGALTGTKRLDPAKSLVLATVNLDAGKTFAPGTMTANPAGQPSLLFRNRDTVTSVGAGNYPATFESVDYGPIPANAGTLTVITIAASGWNSITNAADAVLGRLAEQDTPYRVRRRLELTKPGACTVDAIRADVLQVAGVLSCLVLENTSMSVDGNGLPAKSFHCIVWDGVAMSASNDAIAQAIWNSKPSGIESYGALTGNAIDSTGVTRVVKFSRATQKTIWFKYTLTKDASKYPVDGDTQLANAAVAEGAELGLSDDVIALRFRAVALTIAGVVDVTNFQLDFTGPNPAPTANLTIGVAEVPTFDTARVQVV